MTRTPEVNDERGLVMLEVLVEAGAAGLRSQALKAAMRKRGYPMDHNRLAGTAEHLRDLGFNIVASKGKDATWYYDPPVQRTHAWVERSLRESYTNVTREHRSLTRILAVVKGKDAAVLHSTKVMLFSAAYALGNMAGIDNNRIASDLEVPIPDLPPAA